MKLSGWLLLLVALLGMLSSGCGCCRIVVDLDDPDPAEDDSGDRRLPQPHATPKGAQVDLGNAEYPSGNDEAPVEHPWWVPRLEPEKYRLGYKVPASSAKQVSDDYHRWARSVGHKRIDKDRFQWRPPKRCFGGLQCVYDRLDDGSVDGVEPIAELFRKRVSAQNLSSLDLAALVITFAQEIDYRIPNEEPFGVLPPALVVKAKQGDCDSKSLLAHMVLRSLGIGSVLISSEGHKHTMLGVALPAPGRSFSWQGRKYAFVELTAKRSPIGHINPQLLRPNDWRVVPMSYKPLGRPTTRSGPKTEPDDLEKGVRDIITGGRIRVEG
jgi:hypothetical protein